MLSAHTQSQSLADDAVYLIPRTKGRWEVVTAEGQAFRKPLSTEQADELEGVPLRAILRLYQAPQPHLERIDNLLTCRYLTDAFLEINRHRQLDIEEKKRAFSGLAAIARSVPGYQFHFERSPQTLQVLNREIGF
jgi:hypothetical protein